MENKTVYTPHFIALICAFIMADGVIFMPLYKNSLTELAAVCLLGIAVSFFALKPLGKIINTKNKTAAAAVYGTAAVAALAQTVFSAAEFTRFIYENLLTRENMFFIKLIFALCAAFLAAGGRRAIYKFSLVSAVFITVIFAVMFLVSVKNFDPANIKAAFSLSLSPKRAASYAAKLLLPAALAVLFAAEADFTALPRFSLPAGMAWGTGLVFIVVLDSVLSFGLPLAAKLKYPYIDDISTVTIGSIFTRMDALAYFAFFVCYLVKCAVLIRLAARFACKAGIKKEKPAVYLLSLLLLI